MQIRAANVLLASVIHVDMPDTEINVAARARGERLYRPPAVTPLSLSPNARNGHFQPPQCSVASLSSQLLLRAATGLAWTWPLASTCSAGGVVG